MKQKQIDVYIMLPGEAPYKARIDNTLEALQEIVGGYIEIVSFPKDLIVVCNEEGRLRGLPETCDVCGVDFCGPVIFAGADGEEITDCPVHMEPLIEELN